MNSAESALQHASRMNGTHQMMLARCVSSTGADSIPTSVMPFSPPRSCYSICKICQSRLQTVLHIVLAQLVLMHRVGDVPTSATGSGKIMACCMAGLHVEESPLSVLS